MSAEIAIKKGSSAGSRKSALGQAKKIRGLPYPHFIPATNNVRNRLGKSKKLPNTPFFEKPLGFCTLFNNWVIK